MSPNEPELTSAPSARVEFFAEFAEFETNLTQSLLRLWHRRWRAERSFTITTEFVCLKFYQNCFESESFGDSQKLRVDSALG